MTNHAPKIDELLPLVYQRLVKNPFFAEISKNIKKVNPGTQDKTVVILDLGLGDESVELHLRETGVAVVVAPLTGGENTSQSGPQVELKNEILVIIKTNQKRNLSDEGARMDMYKAIPQVIRCICETPRHPGGEFFKFVKYTLMTFDKGCLDYGLTFTKEATPV